jgi:uncharacterized repeat protein (TIGR02543 family)
VPNDPTKGQTDGGSAYGEVVSGGTTVTLTALPEPGQTFVRWECESGVTEAWCGSTEPVITIPVDSNIWIQPVFTNTTDGKVSITYLATGATGGSAPAPARVNAGSSYTVAGGGNLVRPGHAIQSWNTAPAGAGTSIPFNATINPSGNTVLHPQWVPAATQKTFAATNITMNSATISGEVTSGSVALTVGMGWGTSPSGLVVPAATTQSLAADGATKTLSLSLSGLYCKTTYHYASYLSWGTDSIFDPASRQFTTLPCSVSYNGNGFTGGTVPTGNADMGPGDSVTAAAAGSMVRTGYTFVGWNTNANGSGTAYAVGASVPASSAGVVRLYAQWRASPSMDTDAPSAVTSGGATLSGTVSPGGQAGTAGLAWGTVSGTYASSQQLATLAAGDPAADLSFEATGLQCKTTYYVATWFESGGTRTYGPEQTLTTAGCAVTFDSNGAQTGSVPTGGNNYGPSDGFTVPSNSGGLQRRGYTFNGWNTQADGQGSAFAAGAAVAGLTSSMTLYAQWQQIRSATVTSSDGPVTLQMACTSCALTTADVEAPAGSLPPNTNFPWGLQSFELIDVTGTVTVTLTLPGNIQGTPSLWKSVHGAFSEVSGATFTANSVTYTLTDNGALDEDATVGVIRDPVGVGVAAAAAGAVSVPTLSEWAQAVVTAMLALLGALAVRRRACVA